MLEFNSNISLFRQLTAEAFGRVHQAKVFELRRMQTMSGYLSRVLRSLERQGLVMTRPDREDQRVRRASLIKAGLHERMEIDRRSDALSLSILQALSARQRDRLMTAMGEVERLLQASMVSLAIEDPTSADARWCFNQYFAELNRRFEGGFDPGLSISADPQELTSPMGLLLIARLHGRLIGCGALKFHQRRPAELKRMWIAPAARGLGVGRRLLGELERTAGEAGVVVLRLETNRALSEAIALYKRSGYV